MSATDSYSRLSARRRLALPEVDLRALLQLVGAFHHNQFPWRKAAVDGHVASLGQARLYHPQFNRLILLHNVDKRPLRAPLQRRHRHHHHAPVHTELQTHVTNWFGNSELSSLG